MGLRKKCCLLRSYIVGTRKRKNWSLWLGRHFCHWAGLAGRKNSQWFWMYCVQFFWKDDFTMKTDSLYLTRERWDLLAKPGAHPSPDWHLPLWNLCVSSLSAPAQRKQIRFWGMKGWTWGCDELLSVLRPVTKQRCGIAEVPTIKMPAQDIL